MHKALSSFLIALSIYLLIIAAVLYTYTQYHTKLSEVTTDKSQVVAFDVISAAASKPTPIKKPKSPKESKPKKKPELKKKPVSKVAKQETKEPQKPPLPKTIKKEPIIKKVPVVSLEKPTPAPSPQHIAPTVEKTMPRLIPAPVLIHKDPAKALALKHIPQPIPAQTTKPIRKPASSQIKKRIKKRKGSVKQRKTRQKKHGKSKRSSRGGRTHKKGYSSTAKKRFLARLKSRIDRNKHYPRIAERRGITGSVRVRFTILRNGNVGNISLSGATPFYRSTKSAIKRAFPIDPAKVPYPLPDSVNFVIRYRQ